jgi:folate-binding protein YgfZ
MWPGAIFPVKKCAGAVKNIPMTETATPPATSPTPLAALLLAVAPGGAQPELATYRGALTLKRLDAAEAETAALAFGATAHDLGWLRRVAVRGEDRFRWLNGMVTNAVNHLAPNAGAWNLVLNAQGRIQGDLHVWRDGEELSLVIAADQHEKLLAHLDRFIIMDDVELLSANDTALGLAGPLAAALLERLGLPALTDPMTSVRAEWNGQPLRIAQAYGVLVPHYELWAQADQIFALWKALVEAGATPVGAATLEAFRIAEGIPVYGIDIAERDLPQETSQLRTLSFSKGCYQGQEIVERIRSRGSVHRHLRPLELFGPVPAAGSELTLEGVAAAGQITSAAELPLAAGVRVFALGMIRGEAELRNQSFTYQAGEATGAARILAAPPKLEAC